MHSLVIRSMRKTGVNLFHCEFTQNDINDSMTESLKADQLFAVDLVTDKISLLNTLPYRQCNRLSIVGVLLLSKFVLRAPYIVHCTHGISLKWHLLSAVYVQYKLHAWI